MVMNRGVLLLLVLCFPGWGRAESLASFPADLSQLIQVKQSVIPGKDVVLSADVPSYLLETIRMYNWINEGQGTRLTIYVPKEKLEQYRNHGPYSDGLSAVAIYEEGNVVFVTEHLAGEVLYGTYNQAGQDISDSHPSLAIDTCYACHDGYKDICINGTCGQLNSLPVR
ncbi:hypothetical protein [Shewanella sp. GXUN23E]|uniref:hypothetical protein n=1 Tax=Shewanella sp. GXUN23E TaxID=3422498 RepID=UPI003D7CF70D